MAKGSSRRVRGFHSPNYGTNPVRDNMHMQNNTKILEELDRNVYTHMPPAAKSFLLKKRDTVTVAFPTYTPGEPFPPMTHCLHGHIDLTELVKFWTNPAHIKYTKGEMAKTQCEASWYISREYLKIGMVEEARTLMLNGSFFHQCHNMPIETIVGRINSIDNANAPDVDQAWLIGDCHVRDYDLPLYRRALFASSSSVGMVNFLHGLPQDYDQNMMRNFGTLSSNHDISMMYCDQVGGEWGGTSPASKKSPSKSSTGSPIELFLQDDAKEEERHGFSIDSGTTLKTLFNDYADKRGISLRSFRFSYKGKTLFLSSVGNKTPDELSMGDQDVISVHDTSAVKDTIDDSPSPSNKTSKKSNNNKKNSPKRNKGKSKKKQIKQEKPTLSLEECKTLHSKTLTKIHEEAEPQLKEIRMRLNVLDLERQPPKQKKKRENKKKSNKQSNVNANLRMLPSSGIGGKAGKPFFHIHVGEVSNLYKTTKPSQKGTSVCNLAHSSTTLDLHGFTQEEALKKLDESLMSWVDAAMRGSYPFVVPAKIVCGCGNQVMSEVVEKWIHEHTQVRNSPKGQCC